MKTPKTKRPRMVDGVPAAKHYEIWTAGAKSGMATGLELALRCIESQMKQLGLKRITRKVSDEREP